MKFKTLALLVFLSLNMNAQMAGNLSIGEIHTIESSILNEQRTLNIYLPENYDAQKSYPVIYLLDGSANEDFLHIAGLVQFFNMMYDPDLIVIGIANVDRKRDFVHPTKIQELKDEFPTTGGSEKFIAFIEKELQPYIEERFSTNETRYIIGQSLGGLLATEILLKRPKLFTHYFIVSPSLWWDDESLLKQADMLLKNQTEMIAYVYVSVGSEGKIMERTAREIHKKLTNAKKKTLKTDFLHLPKEDHGTILHLSIYEALKIQYPQKY